MRKDEIMELLTDEQKAAIAQADAVANEAKLRRQYAQSVAYFGGDFDKADKDLAKLARKGKARRDREAASSDKDSKFYGQVFLTFVTCQSHETGGYVLNSAAALKFLTDHADCAGSGTVRGTANWGRTKAEAKAEIESRGALAS